MVKIRYSELPAGLHVAAAAGDEGTVVYLQPGLTPAQRRAALGRVRSSGRMGQGPRLPGPDMAKAIAADRVRTSAQIGTAAARRHPLVVLSPVFALVIAAIAVMAVAVKPLSGGGQAKIAANVPTLHVGRRATSPSPQASSSPAATPTQSAQSVILAQHLRRPPRPLGCTTWPSSADPRWWAAPGANAYRPISMATPCGRHKRMPRWERTWHS